MSLDTSTKRSDTINKRKKLFKELLANKNPLNTDIVNEAFLLCSEDEFTPKKLNVAFARIAIDYLRDDYKSNYQRIIDWMSVLDLDDLAISLKYSSSSKYSDYEMLILYFVKALYFQNDCYEKLMFLYEHVKKHETSGNITSEGLFWIEYNVIKDLYKINQFEVARQLFTRLIRFHKDEHLIMLPIQAYDVYNWQEIIPFVFQILDNPKITFITFNIILKYLKQTSSGEYHLEYCKSNPTKENIQEVKNSIICNIEKNQNTFPSMSIGKFLLVKEKEFGFIKDEHGSYYVNLKNTKVDRKHVYMFAKIDSFDRKKNVNSIEAYIIKEIK